MAELQTLSAYNMPVALDDSHTRTKGFGAEVAYCRVPHNAQEARDHILGPMPINLFVKKFAPTTAAGSTARKALSSRGAFTTVPVWGSSSEDIHGPLLAALSKATKHKGRCPGYVFADMPFHPVYHQIGSQKRYIACYASGNVPSVSPNSELTPSTALGYAEFFLDIHADDYFADSAPSGNFVRLPEDDSEDRRQVDRRLGYHVELVSELLARQNRTFVFTATVFGSRARLMRWDRAGCIASESFDLHSHPELLCDFLEGYANGTAAQRGQDPTIGVANEEEERLFKEAITQRVQYELNVSGEELENAVKEHYAPGRVFVMLVTESDPNTNATSVRRFIVSRPLISPTDVLGRCTRGFWALDPSTGEVVFVKDTWRSPSGEIEGEVISRLLAAGVRNIPSLVCHGDVRSQDRVQKTISGRYQERAWVASKRALSRHIHYRMVLGTVGYGLKHFRGSEELLHATYDAFQAMQDARLKDERLHRDISLGNIILVRDPTRSVRRGVLIDWEVSSQVDANGVSLDRNRTGTWYYMGHKLQATDNVPHTLEDDMESLIWVVLYCALRWIPHDCPRNRLFDIVEALFEERSMRGYGGAGKLVNLLDRSYTGPIMFQEGVHRWLTLAFDYCSPVVVRGMAKPPQPRWSDPRDFDSIWSQLLQRVHLPPDDRCEHPTLPADRPLRSTTPWKRLQVETENSNEDGSEPKRRKRNVAQEDPSKPRVRVQPPRGSKGNTRRGAGAVVKRAGTRSGRVCARAADNLVTGAVSGGHRYSLRSPTEVVSKYRR